MRKYFPAEHLAGKSYTLQMTMVFLAFLFLFLFAGCGREVTGDGEAPGAEPEQEQSSPRELFHWQEQALAEVADFSDGSPIYIVDYRGDPGPKPDILYNWWTQNYYGLVDDKLYVLWRFGTTELEETKYYLYSCDLKSKEMQSNELVFDIPEIPCFFASAGEVIGEDEIVFFSAVDDGETVESYYAVYTNAQGEILRIQDIYPALKEFGVELGVESFFSGMSCDRSGYLYVCDPDLPRVGVIDEAGALIDTIEIQGSYDSGPSCSMKSPEGIPIFELIRTSEGKSTMFWYDLEEQGIRILAQTAYMGMWPKCMNRYGEIYLYLLDKIVRWDGASGSRERIFDCRSNGVGANGYMMRLLTSSDGDLFMLDFGSGTMCLYEFSDEPVEVTDSITVANLGWHYDDDLRGFAASFSRENPSCRIEFEKPDDRADFDERQAYRNRVMAELVSGKGPEMMLLSGDELKLLYEKGALADISDVFPEETREQIFSSVLEAGSFDGKLIGLVNTNYFSRSGFGMRGGMTTAFVSKDVWTKETWTVEEFIKLVEEREEELVSVVAGGFNHSDFFELVISDLDNTPFIDWEKKECYFDGELFRKTLELTMNIKKKRESSSSAVNYVPYSDINDYYEYLRQQRDEVLSGEAIVYVDNNIASLADFSSDMAMLGEDFFCVGFPTNSGNGSYFSSENTYLAVNNAAENKDVIYQFLQYVYNEQNQRAKGSSTVRRDVLISFVVYPEWATEAQFSRGGGEYELLDCKPDGTSYLEEYLELIEGCVRSPLGTDKVREIIEEEVSGYFAEEKDIDRTVETIQRRVQLYLDEQ